MESARHHEVATERPRLGWAGQAARNAELPLQLISPLHLAIISDCEVSKRRPLTAQVKDFAAIADPIWYTQGTEADAAGGSLSSQIAAVC